MCIRDSIGSHPTTDSRSVAASGTVRAIGPIWSSEEAKAMRPYRLTSPQGGLAPTVPVSEAGWRIDPPVSEPKAPRADPTATAAAEPPEEPPGTVSVFHGLRVGPYAEFSVDDPMANSSRLVLPTITAPASLRRRTAVPS